LLFSLNINPSLILLKDRASRAAHTRLFFEKLSESIKKAFLVLSEGSDFIKKAFLVPPEGSDSIKKAFLVPPEGSDFIKKAF
jgi:hypothetical protein